MATGTIRTKDGVELFYRLRPIEQAGAVALVVHGFAEHSGRYGHVFDWLGRRGFNVLGFDLRGHGYSKGRRGHIDSFEQYVNDVDAAVLFARRKFPGERLFLVGHSMGGLIALHYAHQHREHIDGLVVSSPFLGFRIHVPAWKRALATLMSWIVPNFKLPNEIVANDLTHDKSKVMEYAQDNLIFHHACARWYRSIVVAQKKAGRFAGELDLPMLFQLAGDDRIVDSEASRKYFQKCVSPDRTLEEYAGFLHEIYNEVERERPLEDMSRWLVAHMKERINATDPHRYAERRSESP